MKLLKNILTNRKTVRFINEILMIMVALGLIQMTICAYPGEIYESTRLVLFLTILLLYVLIHIYIQSSSIKYLEDDEQNQGKEDE